MLAFICFFFFTFSSKFQLQASIFLGYDQSEDMYLECPINYFLLNSSLNLKWLNINVDCHLRSLNDLTSEIKIYVGNTKCNNNPSNCDGTRENPFDNLFSALWKVHEDNVAKFFEQKIDIYLMGKKHYLIFDDLKLNLEDKNVQYARFFRGLNAKITIAPLFCEDYVYEGCLFKSAHEKAELIIKTDRFIFEVKQEIKLVNLKIKGNDIILSEDTQKLCFHQAITCCEPTDLLLETGECGIMNKTLVIREYSKISKINGFIFLRNFFPESDIIIYPKVNLTNVDIVDINAIKNEEGWLGFIFFNDLGFQINLDNVYISNTMFPFGIIHQIQVNNDPYYNSLANSQIEEIYKTNYIQNFMSINNCIIDGYNLYKIKTIFLDDDFLVRSIFSANYEKSSSSMFIIKEIKIINFNLNFTQSETTFCFSFIDDGSKFANVSLEKVIFENNIGIGFLNLKVLPCICKFMIWKNVQNYYTQIINIADSPFFLIENGNFSESILTRKKISLTATNSFVTFKNFTFLALKESIGFFKGGTLIFDTVFFLEILYANSLNFIETSDANLIINSTFMKGCSFLSYVGTIFSITSSEKPIVFEFKNSYCENVYLYRFFLFKSILKQISINICKLKFFKIFGVSNSRFNQLFFLDLFSGYVDVINFTNVTIYDSESLLMIFLTTGFNKVLIKDVILINIWNVCYYILTIYNVNNAKSVNTEIKIENLYIKNMKQGRFLPLFYIKSTQTVNLTSYTHINVTTIMEIYQGNKYTFFFQLYEMKYFIVDKMYFVHNSPTLAKLIFAFEAVLNLNFTNTIIKSESLQSWIRKFQVFTIYSFKNVVFVNNTIVGMSGVDPPVSIMDETGAISFLCENVYGLVAGNNCTLDFSNNLLLENYGSKYGIIGFVGIQFLNIFNNTFVNNRAIYGSGMFIAYVNCSNIQKISAIYSSTYDGGFFYILEVKFKITIADSFFLNTTSLMKAGVFFIKNVKNIEIYNITIQNSEALLDGGIAYILNVESLFFYNLQCTESYAMNGGMFYIDSSNVHFDKSFFKKGVAAYGGFGYFWESNTVVFISYCEFSEFYATNNGAVINLLNSKEMFINASKFLNNHVQDWGTGIINIETYSADASGFGLFEFENLYFTGNVAFYGSILYFSSFYRLNIFGLIADNNSGCLFKLESERVDDKDNLYFQNISIANSNFELWFVKKSSSLYENPIFSVYGANIHFENINFQFNLIKQAAFFITKSQLSLTNSQINDNYYINDDNIKEFEKNKILMIISSKILLEKNKFYYQFRPEEQCQIFDILNSNLASYNDSFSRMVITDLPILRSDSSQLSFELFNLRNNYCARSAMLIKSSNLTINYSSFSNNSYKKGEQNEEEPFSNILFESLKGKFNSFIIESSSFDNLANDILYVFHPYRLMIKNTTFFSSDQTNISHTNRAINFIGFTQTMINITNVTFKNMNANIGSCIYASNFYPFMTLSVEQSFFSNNLAFIGGAIYIVGEIKLYINSSLFVNNSAVISTATSDLPTFVYKNDIGKAGCILINCEFFNTCESQIKNTYFLDNTAEAYGPTILSKSLKTPEIKNCTFQDNKDNLLFSESILGTPINVQLLSINFTLEDYGKMSNLNNSQRSKMIKDSFPSGDEVPIISSGQKFNLSVILLDSFGQILMAESQSESKITCLSNSSSSKSSKENEVLLQRSIAHSSNGLLFFLDFEIITNPNTLLNCLIEIDFSDYLLFKSYIPQNSKAIASKSLNVPLSLFVRRCVIGELYKEDETCFKCTPGSFSLLPSESKTSATKCSDCPINAFCVGGKEITPISDFWRASEFSTLLLKCLTGSCLGGSEDSFNNLTESERIHGVCGQNYYGNICFYCKEGWVRVWNKGECEKCDDNTTVYLKNTFVVFLMVSYIIIQANIFSKEDEKNDPHMPVLSKILLNHFQTVSVINLASIQWNMELNLYFDFKDAFSFISQDFFVIDCIMNGTGEELLIQKIIFTILLPFIIGFLMFCLWLIFFIYMLIVRTTSLKKKLYPYVLEKMRITFLVLIFILYSEILRKSLSLLNCMTIDDSNNLSVLEASPNLVCWTENHYFWVFTVSLPGLIFWGILVPIGIFIILQKYKREIYEIILRNEIKAIKEIEKLKNSFKKKRIVRKIISIDLEEELAKKLFLDGRLPEKKQVGYIVNQIKIIQSVEFIIKSKDEIIQQLRNQVKKTEKKPKQKKLKFIKKQNRSAKFLITDPVKLFEYFENNFQPHNPITEQDLKNYMAFVQETFEEIHNNLLIKQKSSGILPQNTNRNKTKTLLLIENFGFIFPGYRKECYFWEMVIFLRKFILILIGMFNELFPKHSKPTAVVIILITFIFIQLLSEPYEHEYMNKLEAISLISCFFTACIMILIFSQSFSNMGIYLFIVIFLINSIFFLAIFYDTIRYGKIRQKFFRFKKNTKISAKKLVGKFREAKNTFVQFFEKKSLKSTLSRDSKK